MGFCSESCRHSLARCVCMARPRTVRGARARTILEARAHRPETSGPTMAGTPPAATPLRALPMPSGGKQYHLADFPGCAPAQPIARATAPAVPPPTENSLSQVKCRALTWSTHSCGAHTRVAHARARNASSDARLVLARAGNFLPASVGAVRGALWRLVVWCDLCGHQGCRAAARGVSTAFFATRARRSAHGPGTSVRLRRWEAGHRLCHRRA